MTTYGISDNGIEHVETETATASLTSSHLVKTGQPSARAVLARPTMVAKAIPISP